MVGVRRRHRVVGDHHHRVAVLVDDLAQQREHLASGAGVERSGRLVGEHDLRPGDERPGDRDPLLLSAGELRGTVAQALLQPDARGDLAHRRAPRAATVEAQRQADVLSDGERGQQVEGLKDEPDPLAPQDRQPPLAQSPPARCRRARPCPEVGRSSPAATFRNVLLPEPDGPMIAVNDPAREADADAVESDDRSVAPAVDLADVAEGDRLSGGPPRKCGESS